MHRNAPNPRRRSRREPALAWTHAVAGLLLWVALAPPAAAAEPSPADAPVARPGVDLAEFTLEQLMEVRIEKVFGASKYEQQITRAPAAVTIVTGEEIARYGHRTLMEVLRSVPGLYAANDGNYSYLGSRGFLRPGDYNSRTLLLIDGHRMNENLYDSSNFGRENMVDTDEIERIEVIRGPSSSIYGSSAFLGVINVVTRRGHQLNGWEIAGEAGSFGTVQGRVSYGRAFRNDREIFFSASRYHSDGRDAIYYPEFDQRISANPRAANDGVAENSDGEDATRLRGNVRLGEWTLAGFYATRDKTVPTASFLTMFNTRRQWTNDARGYLELQFEHAFDADLRLQGRTSFDSYVYEGDYPSDYAAPGDPPDMVINKDRARGQWLSTEWQATKIVADRHTLVFGAELRDNLREYQSNYDEIEPRLWYFDDDRSSVIVGGYVQSEIALRSNLLLNAGLRYDHYFDSFGGTLNPRLGLIYNPEPPTTVKALFGQAFRAPNPYERFYYAENAPAALMPEKIRTYEFVVEHYFTGNYRCNVSAYQYRVRDLISQLELPDGAIYFANVDRYTAGGVELAVDGHSRGNAHLRASYAYQRATDDATGAELTNSPRHLAKLNLSFPIMGDRLTAGWELQYTSAVRTLAGATADDYLLGNLTLTTSQLPAGFTLSATIYNLFNTRYGHPGAVDHTQDVLPQEGRGFRLKLSRRF